MLASHKLAEKDSYPFCNGNPSTVIGAFFQNAKKSKNNKFAKITLNEWSDLQFIMYNKSYPTFNGRKLSNLLQGIVLKNGTWEELKAHGLTKPLSEAVTDFYDSYNNRDFSLIFRSLSQLNMGKQAFRESPFYDLFIKGITKHLHQFNIVDLSVTFLTLVSLGFTWQDLKLIGLDTPLLRALTLQINSLDDISTANLLWSFAHLDIPWEEIQACGMAKALVQTAETYIPEYSLTLLDQIQVAKLWYEFELEGDMERILEERLAELPKPKSSEFHKNIAAMIYRLTDEPFEIEKCFEKVLFVDLCFGKTGIEVNGPWHEDIEELDIFKTKLLKKLGVTIDCIDYKDDITSDYIKQKLRKNGIPLREDSFQVVRPRRSSFNADNFIMKQEEDSTSGILGQIEKPGLPSEPIQDEGSNRLVAVPVDADEKAPSSDIQLENKKESITKQAKEEAKEEDKEVIAVIETQPTHVENTPTSSKKKKKAKKKAHKLSSNEQKQSDSPLELTQDGENKYLLAAQESVDEKTLLSDVQVEKNESTSKQAKEEDKEVIAVIKTQPTHVENTPTTSKKKKKAKKKANTSSSEQVPVIAKECQTPPTSIVTPPTSIVKNYKLWGGLFAVGAAAIWATSSHIMNHIDSLHKPS